MADPPQLSETIKRKLALEWDTLREEHSLTKEHVAQHDRNRNSLRDSASRGVKFLFAEEKQIVTNLSPDPSVGVAEGRFRSIDSEYWSLWDSSGTEYERYRDWLDNLKLQVLEELASIWKGMSAATDQWFEESCRPTAEKALTTLAKERIAKARERESQRLMRAAAKQKTITESDICEVEKARIQRKVSHLVDRKCPNSGIGYVPFRDASLTDWFETELFSILELGGRELVRCELAVAGQRSGGHLPHVEVKKISNLTSEYVKTVWHGAGGFRKAEFLAVGGLHSTIDSTLLRLEDSIYDEAQAAARDLANPQQTGELPASTHRTAAEESRSAAYPSLEELANKAGEDESADAQTRPFLSGKEDIALLEVLTKSETRDAQLKQRLAAAMEVFERQPGYEKAQIWLSKRIEKLLKAAGPESSLPLGGPARAELVLNLIDVRAKAYLRLVSNIEAQNAFVEMLALFEILAWEEFVGGYPNSVRDGAPSIDQQIGERKRLWIRKGYEQLDAHASKRGAAGMRQQDPESAIVYGGASAAEQPSPATGANTGNSTDHPEANAAAGSEYPERVPGLRTDLIKDWIEHEGWTNKSLAQRLDLSKRVISSMRNNGKYHPPYAPDLIRRLWRERPDRLGTLRILR